MLKLRGEDQTGEHIDDISQKETALLPVMDGHRRADRDMTPGQSPGQGMSGDEIALLDTLVLPITTGGLGAADHGVGRWVGSNLASDISLLNTVRMTAVSASVPSSLAAMKVQVVRGTLSMLVREGLLKIVILVANVLLARLLAPADFGIFVILGFFNTFLSAFGTFGLGAALIQRQREPTRAEVAALFTTQLLAAVILSSAMGLAGPLLSDAYALGPDGIWLIRAMAASFLLTTMAATPTALLERRLAFGRVAMIDVLTGLWYQIIAVALAYLGFGVWSLVAATIASSALRLLASFPAANWWPRLSLRWRRILPMVIFGMQYQAVSVIVLIKDAIVPIYVAAVVGITSVGYIEWASTVAFYPLILVAIIARVTFPTYARLAGDRERLQRVIEMTLRLQAYVIYPAAAVIAALAEYITRVIFTDKWLPAVPLIYFFLAATLAASINSTLTAALTALGRPRVVLYLMAALLVFGWAIKVPFVLWLGNLGYAIADALLGLAIVIFVYVFKRYQSVRVLHSISLPLLAAVMSGAAVYLASQLVPPTTLPLLAGEASSAFLLFLVAELILDGHFRRDVPRIIHTALARTAVDW